MPAQLLPARARTARHRAVRSPALVLSELLVTAGYRLARARRRSAVMVASSGLVISMFAVPASAAPAGSHATTYPAIPDVARAQVEAASPVQVSDEDAWTFDGPAVSVATCTPNLPATIGQFSGEQVVNAAEIILAGKALGLNSRGQTVAVMTAIGESTLTNVDFGDGAGPDSRGLFQQRANGAWGSYSDRMDPGKAARSFIRELVKVPGWEHMEPTLAAHAVQRNADPNHYQQFWSGAVEIVGQLSTDPDLASKVPAPGVERC